MSEQLALAMPVMPEVCQVREVGTGALTCPSHESGGYRCEVIGPHTEHAVGPHTIEHAGWGNGHRCDRLHLARMPFWTWGLA